MNNEIFNQPSHHGLRKRLRNNLTMPEAILWTNIKGSQLLGSKFRRQQGIGKFIVDFYCPKSKLVIEIDGDSHFSENAQFYDQERDGYLKRLGLNILRFTNKDIMENINGVIEVITGVLKITTPTPSSKTRYLRPSKGEEKTSPVQSEKI